MKRNTNLRIYFVVLALVLSNLACSLFQSKATQTKTPTGGQVITQDISPTLTLEMQKSPTLPVGSTPTAEFLGDLIHQWATTGEASSQYGSLDWSAQQAAGMPDTLICGDHITAWASMDTNTVETITMYYYDQPLIPVEVNIVQSYNPSQVVKVEILDPYGEYGDVTIYEGEPIATLDCPYTLSIPVTDISYAVMGVRITVDQSVLKGYRDNPEMLWVHLHKW
jgi:hypothetical protein